MNLISSTGRHESNPGNFAFIGNGSEGAHGMPLHNAGYDFNDAALGTGASFWVKLAEAYLSN